MLFKYFKDMLEKSPRAFILNHVIDNQILNKKTTQEHVGIKIRYNGWLNLAYWGYSQNILLMEKNSHSNSAIKDLIERWGSAITLNHMII